MALPDYSQAHCICEGNRVLENNSGSEARVLDSDDVNTLVRKLSCISAAPNAQEEWWGGPVASDHFVRGLQQFLSTPIHTREHQFRIWITNTQDSSQSGSHWFTVAVASLPESDPNSSLVVGSCKRKRTSVAESGVAVQIAAAASSGQSMLPSVPTQSATEHRAAEHMSSAETHEKNKA